ncbi:unnamed protein product [Chrysoparadoxa australica]
MDCTVMVWDITTLKRVLVLEGHEATVCCIAADLTKIVSGAADKCILVWSPEGKLLRTLHGHSKSVISLKCGEGWILSGGADGDIRLWGPRKGVAEVSGYTCKNCLSGHQHPVSCVSYGVLEIVSGHQDGTLIVWWADSGLVMLKVKVHSAPIRDLQFDATKIVSAGNDEIVAVTDLTTGEPMMSLRGHTGPVISVAFDQRKIMSASMDGTLRHWEWDDGNGARQDKYHIFDRGDNLARISQTYGVSVGEILRWNGIRDARKVTTGVRLIVKKGDPTEMTEAEKEMLQQDIKDKHRSATIENARKLAKADEVEKLDPKKSTGIGRAREDPYSLASRVARDVKEFGEMWETAASLRIVEPAQSGELGMTLGGRIMKKVKEDAERVQAFDNLSMEGIDDEEEPEENVLIQQKREAEQTIADLDNIVLTRLLHELLSVVAREALRESAPSWSVMGRINTFLKQEGESQDLEDQGLSTTETCGKDIEGHVRESTLGAADSSDPSEPLSPAKVSVVLEVAAGSASGDAGGKETREGVLPDPG